LSTVRYYASNFQYLQYIPLWHHWLLSFNSTLDYAEPLGKTTALRLFELFRRRPGQRARVSRETLGPGTTSASATPMGAICGWSIAWS